MRQAPRQLATAFRQTGEATLDTGCLYVVATPIGNLEDITARAVRILKATPTLTCEDTRRCRILLRHIGAEPSELIPLHERNEAAASRLALRRLAAGRDVALVSDAGTPLVSDPGFELVRQAAQEGVRVVPIPGPSALTAALSASPVAGGRFVFEGFLPARRTARRAALERVLRRPEAVVFFEAPHRIEATFADLVDLGAAERPITVARELTKVFETILHGSVADVAAELGAPRGEYVCILAGAAAPPLADAEGVLEALLEELPPAQAARLAGKLTGAPRAALYQQATLHRPDARRGDRPGKKAT